MISLGVNKSDRKRNAIIVEEFGKEPFLELIERNSVLVRILRFRNI